MYQQIPDDDTLSATTDHLWGIILASGDVRRSRWGFRLPLLRPSRSGMLRSAIERAGDLIPASRLVAMPAQGHEAGDELAGVRYMAQPAYRGSAVELFLGLLVIARQDPGATVVVLPAAEAARYEGEFMAAIGRAAAIVASRPDLLLVLGATSPHAAVSGWIEPGEILAGLEAPAVRAVRRFVRHPGLEPATARPEPAGLRNTGVVVASAHALLAVGQRRVPDILDSLEPLETVFGRPEERLLCAAIYEDLPYADLAHALFTADEPFGVLAVARARSRVRRGRTGRPRLRLVASA